MALRTESDETSPISNGNGSFKEKSMINCYKINLQYDYYALVPFASSII